MQRECTTGHFVVCPAHFIELARKLTGSGSTAQHRWCCGRRVIAVSERSTPELFVDAPACASRPGPNTIRPSGWSQCDFNRKVGQRHAGRGRTASPSSPDGDSHLVLARAHFVSGALIPPSSRPTLCMIFPSFNGPATCNWSNCSGDIVIGSAPTLKCFAHILIVQVAPAVPFVFDHRLRAPAGAMRRTTDLEHAILDTRLTILGSCGNAAPAAVLMQARDLAGRYRGSPSVQWPAAMSSLEASPPTLADWRLQALEGHVDGVLTRPVCEKARHSGADAEPHRRPSAS